MFLTVGNRLKVEHLVETYGVRRDHIFSSRDDSFVEGIKVITNGVGVDVVLKLTLGRAFACVMELRGALWVPG